jgi:hypothetical protein
MPQVTLYLDEETDQVLAQSASRAGMSKSRRVAQLIRRHAKEGRPQECLNLAGAFPDFPLRDPASEASLPSDTPRVAF